MAATVLTAPGRAGRLAPIIRRMHESVEPSDGQLIQAYAGGDAGAFDTLYDRHALALWRFVQRSVQQAELADELAQEVWFSVVREAARYEARARFRTWLFTLAHHRVVDHWRRHRPHASLDASTEDGATLADTLAAESGFGPERRLDSREQAQALLDALAALPPTQRQAFLLQAEGGLSVAEIAAATGVNAETAKSRLRYARARLRETLEAFA
jgi:RNA polymerase sigma-70 factor (ECF subfamily)